MAAQRRSASRTSGIDHLGCITGEERRRSAAPDRADDRGRRVVGAPYFGVRDTLGVGDRERERRKFDAIEKLAQSMCRCEKGPIESGKLAVTYDAAQKARRHAGRPAGKPRDFEDAG